VRVPIHAVDRVDGSGTVSGADPTITFECPRCHQPVEERFYGPCSTCRATLRSSAAEQAPQILPPENDEQVPVPATATDDLPPGKRRTPWTTLIDSGWSIGPLASCVACGVVTVARNPQGDPHHAVCPKDYPTTEPNR